MALSHVGYQCEMRDPWTLKARPIVWKLQRGESLEHPFMEVGHSAKTSRCAFPIIPKHKMLMAHSTVMTVAMGSGIPALVFLIWILGAAIRKLVTYARDVSERSVSALLLAVAVMLIGFATRNLFDYMLIGSLAYLVWILLAVGMEAGQRGLAARS